MIRDFDDAQRGQILILAALVMVVLLTLAGLVIDGGILLIERRKAQTAADAAALAAAYDLLTITDPAAAQAAARYSALSYAAQNGYNNDGTTNTVTVNIPPTSGPYAGDSKAIQVSISKTMTTFLIHVTTGSKVATAGASGVARADTGTPPFSLLALDPHRCSAAEFAGNGTTQIAGTIKVNSDCQPNAMYACGSASVSAQAIQVNGGFVDEGGPSVSPAPVTGSPPIVDPLAALPPPNLSELPTRHASAAYPDIQIIEHSTNLFPGIYYGGIWIKGNAVVTLNPGIYYLAGGGFKKEGNAIVTGEQIMIYNGKNPGPCLHNCSAGDYGGVYIAGGGRVELDPITDPSQSYYDPYNGVLFFQERENTRVATIAGNDSWDVNGTQYLPDAHVDLTGSGNMGSIQLIVDSILVTGSGNLTIPSNEFFFHKDPDASLVQ